LGLVPFEFFPHLEVKPTHMDVLVDYSRRNRDRAIWACADGDGVVVENGEARPIGPVVEIHKGVVRLIGGADDLPAMLP
jgi:dipeptidase E